MKELNKKLDRLSTKEPSRYMRRERPFFQNTRPQYQQNTRPQYQQNVQFPSPGTPHQAQNKPFQQRERPIQCFACKGFKHIQKDCNWTGQENTNGDFVCQLCSQHGHGALSCKTLYSGNFKHPADSGHGQSG